MNRSNPNLLPFLICLGLGMTASPGATADTLDFNAEHILEAPMDAAYLAFPQIPVDTSTPETRLQPGYLSLSGGIFDETVPMISAQHFHPLDSGWGLLIGGFYGKLNFSGSNGAASEEVTFVQSQQFNGLFDVNVSNISGDANHYGISAAITRDMQNGKSWQIGVAAETLDVNEFAVEFNSAGFSGRLDYAGEYTSITPYGSMQWTRSGNGNLFHTARIIAALPLPREGFQGRITGQGVDLSGDTGSAGRGKHIPDPFLGFGYTLEHKKSGLRVDLGASLFMLGLEPLIHDGIDTPVYVNVSVKLD